MPLTRLGPLALLFVASACSSADLGGEDADTNEPIDDTADPSDTAPDDNDSGSAPPEPSWIRVDGSLTVVGGIPDPTASTLAIEYQVAATDEPGADVDTADTDLDTGPVLPCTRTPTLTAITPATAPDAAITMGWWAITFDDAPDPICDHALPQGLHLGLGALDTQLYAAMDLAGLATSDSSLYGLYVRIGSEAAPVWVYGVAGTEGQYGGVTAPASAPPLPDGAYTLQALHLLPYP